MRGKAKVWAALVIVAIRAVRPLAKVNRVKLGMISNTSLQLVQAWQFD